MEKLQLKYLAPYLPYGLKIYFESLDGSDKTNWELTWDKIGFCLENNNKPILRPLSDLTKEIEHNGEKFVTNERLYEMYGGGYNSIKGFTDSTLYDFKTPELLTYNRFCVLLKWHFDVLGLIEKGLAIDINSLTPNNK